MILMAKLYTASVNMPIGKRVWILFFAEFALAVELLVLYTNLFVRLHVIVSW